jgi:hypothetical protein
LRFVPLEEDDDGSEEVTVDFEKMTIDVFTHTGERASTDAYRLRRSPAGVWEVKLEYHMIHPGMRLQSPEAKVRDRYRILGGKDESRWKPGIAAEYQDDLTRVLNWCPLSYQLSWVSDDVCKLVERKYSEMLRFFEMHPGVTPGMEHDSFISGRYESKGMAATST